MTFKKRLYQLITWAGLILGIGLAYAIWVWFTGLAIPCPFRLITGLWCPGCGVTRMCLSLLGLDLRAAWQANAALLLLLPVLAVLLAQQMLQWLRTGKTALSRGQNILLWVIIAALLLFGVARNLPHLTFLAPAG